MYVYTKIIVHKLVFFSSEMFKLNEIYEVDTRILKRDYKEYFPSEKSTLNTGNSQININTPREDSVIGLLNSYLDLVFDVLHAATGKSYIDNSDIRLVILGTFALFGKFKSTTSSGKLLEDISHTRIVSLM